MPANMVKSVAKKKHKPVSKVEHDWQRAKKIAQKEYGAGHWGAVTHIFENMEHMNERKHKSK